MRAISCLASIGPVHHGLQLSWQCSRANGDGDTQSTACTATHNCCMIHIPNCDPTNNGTSGKQIERRRGAMQWIVSPRRNATWRRWWGTLGADTPSWSLLITAIAYPGPTGELSRQPLPIATGSLFTTRVALIRIQLDQIYLLMVCWYTILTAACRRQGAIMWNAHRVTSHRSHYNWESL